MTNVTAPRTAHIQRPANATGFTLMELLVAVVLSAVVITAALSVANSSLLMSREDQLSESRTRSARFIRASFDRDFHLAGVGISSSSDFGSVNSFGDTIAILSVPFDSVDAPAYRLFDNGTVLQSGRGNCGTRCIEVDLQGGDFTIKNNDLVRIQTNSTTRLVVARQVSANDSTATFTFRNLDKVLGFPSGLTARSPYPAVLLDYGNTFVQELQFSAYHVEAGQLYRAEEIHNRGDIQSAEFGGGISNWGIEFQYADGDVGARPDPEDGDDSNDFDDILAVTISADIRPEYDPIGSPSARNVRWTFVPRNLMYERNRIR